MKLELQAPALGALGLVFCLTQPALAQIGKTSVGMINATVDGVAYAGETFDVPSEGTSTAAFRSFGPVTSLTIQAHDPQAESIMHNVLSVEISLMGSDASASVMEASVSWWPKGMSEPFYHSEESGTEAEVVLNSLSLGGDAAIVGRFSARVCRRDSFFAEIDTGDCLDVEGTFDTRLHSGG